MMAVAQVQQAPKFEPLIPPRSTESLTTRMSFDYQRDHFGALWGLVDQGGGVAHTGRVVPEMRRSAVAVFATHGIVLDRWPSEVRASPRFWTQ